jgi:hypothetical protein
VQRCSLRSLVWGGCTPGRRGVQAFEVVARRRAPATTEARGVPCRTIHDRASGLQIARGAGQAGVSNREYAEDHWWAHVDSNHGPLPYQAGRIACPSRTKEPSSSQGATRTEAICSENQKIVSQRVPTKAIVDRPFGLQNDCRGRRQPRHAGHAGGSGREDRRGAPKGTGGLVPTGRPS